jgi:hypothetical protein
LIGIAVGAKYDAILQRSLNAADRSFWNSTQFCLLRFPLWFAMAIARKMKNKSLYSLLYHQPQTVIPIRQLPNGLGTRSHGEHLAVLRRIFLANKD